MTGYGGFCGEGLGFPPNFQLPLAAKLCGEIWHGGVPNFIPIGAKISVQVPKTEHFTKSWNINAYPLSDFHEICRLCTSFQVASAVKTWVDLLDGLRWVLW